MKKNTTFPKVTIAIPTYNGGIRIRTAVESVVSQSYPNYEILIADNCSSAETGLICRELAETYPQIRYFRHKENIGMLANFDFLLRPATGTYFMWLADDDTMPEGVLSRYVDFLEGHPEYSLVSGAIEYSINNRITEYERGLNFSQRLPHFRVIGYYFRVVHGAMFHGLMRTELARKVVNRRVIGSDWHFVATLAFLGRLRNLEFTGYRKKFGGSSRNLEAYAKMIGDTPFAGRYPFMKIAMDAYREIMHRSDVFAREPFYKRFPLALLSFLAVLSSYYLKIYPRIVGGRVKHSFQRMVTAAG